MAVQNSQSENQNRLSIPSEKLLQIPPQNGTTKKENQPENNETVEAAPTATLVVPLDGGWAWVVCAASFMCCLIVDGIVMSAGMFKTSFLNHFDASDAEVTLVGSLLSGFYLIAGPFASALANRWGFRVVTIAGAIMAAICFAAASVAPSMTYLYIVYGVLGGIGFSLIYIPAVIIVSYYFERWRALATGVAMCGSGVGTFIMAPLSNYLISTFGWEETLRIQAYIILVCVVCALAFRPLDSVEVTIDETKPEEKEKQLPVIFTKPLAEGRYAFSVPSSSHNTWIGAGSNTRYPTAAEVFRGSAANLDRRTSLTPSATPNVNSTTTTQLNAGNLHTTTRKLEQFSKTQQKQRNTSGTATPEENAIGSVPVPVFNIHKELNTVGEDDENENETLLNANTKPQLSARRHTVSGRRPTAQPGKKEARTQQTLGSNNRPLYRDDIFFSGSLLRIPQYQSQSSLGYHMSVTRMPTKQDVQEEASCKLCPEAVRRTLATMLDVSLLKSPSFMLLALSGLLTMMGFFVPFFYLAPRAASQMDASVASFIISAIGISNTVARILCGLLSSFNIDALYLNNVAITIGGIATILSGWSLAQVYQFSYAAIFGVAIACFSALRSIIAVELMGLEKLTNAFGILMLFQGVAAVVGAPIAGLIYDSTKNYNYCFFFAGTLITISAVLCFPLRWVNNWEKRRAEEATKKQNTTA